MLILFSCICYCVTVSDWQHCTTSTICGCISMTVLHLVYLIRHLEPKHLFQLQETSGDKWLNRPLSRSKSVKSLREMNAVLSRWPLHPDVSLCCLTHGKLQDLTKHRGHLYLNSAAWHTSQCLLTKTHMDYYNYIHPSYTSYWHKH